MAGHRTDTLVPSLLWDGARAQRLVSGCLEPRGFTCETYGTARWLRGNPGAERLLCPPAPSRSAAAERVEHLPNDIAARFAGLSFELASPDEVTAAGLNVLAEGWSLAERVPAIGQTVTALVRAIHLLRSPGAGYDTSHSNPELPCSIFLSLPADEPFAALRVAESIVHEAMHLQLTFLESARPLVEKASTSKAYSPWQKRERPITGVIHGLYVFRAIDSFLDALIENGLRGDEETFARKRRCEMADEIEQVASILDAPDLTRAGRALVTMLLSPADLGNPEPLR